MRLASKEPLALALAVTALLSLTAAGYSHGFVFRWWFRPPAPAIPNVTFADGVVEHGAVRTFVVTDGSLVSFARDEISDGTFSATVTDGVLSFANPIAVTSDNEASIEITLEDATLRRNILNSTFSADGLATVSVTTTVTDPDTGETSDVTTTTEIPISVFGLISGKNDVYKLRAHVRGLTSSDDGAGTTTYVIFKLELEATGAPTPVAP